MSNFFSLETHHQLFPFGFITDSGGDFISVGPTLKKLDPAIGEMNNVLDYFSILKPNAVELTHMFEKDFRKMIVIEHKVRGFKLMGQVVQIDSTENYAFVVNLFINDINQLSQLKLTFNDFALQDQVFDFLMLLQTHQRAINDAEKINVKLSEASKIAIKASEMKSQFLANMSHELRTPMNGVLGMASILVESPLDEEQADYVKTIISSGEAMLELINDILDISKVEAGHINIQNVKFSLHQILSEVSNTLEVQFHKKGLELIVDGNLQNDGYFWGDPDRIRQIILNFTGNAVKFTEKGRVTIRFKQIDDVSDLTQLHFEIEDTGIGMDSDTIARIFNPFVQGDSSTTKKFGGTGLGLAICKRIITAMQGEVGVTSTPGKGSTFSFYIKLGKEKK